MPVLRSPFEALVTPGKPLVLDAKASGASFKLFISSMTPVQRRNAKGQEEDDDAARPACTTLYVQTAAMAAPLAVGSVASDRLYSERVRVTVPVMRGAGEVRLMALGPDAVCIAGDQHTIMSREQVDAIGFQAQKVEEAAAAKNAKSAA